MATASPNGDAVSRIRQFVVQTFPLARKRKITDATDLLDSGVIDSLGVLDLVAFLQQEFSVVVDDGDLVPENFRSIECMAHFVERMIDADCKTRPMTV